MSRIAPTIDPAAIRMEFPSIRDGRVFLDNPGGTQVHQSVYDAVADYYRDANANLGGPFATSVASDRMLDEARAEAAAFLGASPAEIVFGANMTTLTMHASRILCRGLGPGDEILVTGLDHDANVAPWMLAASDRGVTVRQAGIDTESCLVDVDDFAGKLTGRTRIAAFGWASNGAGTVNDVARLSALCREAGAISYIDAVHYAPHGAIDVAAVGCDFLVCSAYKFFGPHVGVLYGRHELLERHRPYKVRPAPDEAPHSWETGTINLEGIAGTTAAMRYLRSLGMDNIAVYERDLAARLLEGLDAIAGLTVYGTRDLGHRCPTVAFTVAGKHPADVSRALAERDIFVWDGNYYALELMQRLGLQETGGAVRVGAVHYNTVEEIDAFLEAVARLALASRPPAAPTPPSPARSAAG
jgi:cysteine desulfurase family protein (TIGR01976 family)